MGGALGAVVGFLPKQMAGLMGKRFNPKQHQYEPLQYPLLTIVSKCWWLFGP